MKIEKRSGGVVMDLSDTYIKMCRAATDIQELKFEMESCWFPTFEQYLKIYSEMNDVRQESLALLWLVDWFREKETEDHEFCFKYKTKEEIALMWVQETCFNHIWDGEQWI